MRTKNQIFILCGIVVFCAVALLKFPSKDYIGYVFYSIYAQLQGIIQGSQLTVSLMEFHISKTWNGSEIDHTPVVISLSGAGDKGLQVNVKAPFFNSPPAPNSPAGQPCDRLWDYEGDHTISIAILLVMEHLQWWKLSSLMIKANM